MKSIVYVLVACLSIAVRISLIMRVALCSHNDSDFPKFLYFTSGILFFCNSPIGQLLKSHLADDCAHGSGALF
jgi:hypothetical protein